MSIQQITGAIFIALISAISACNTSPPDAKTQIAKEMKEMKEMTIFDEGKETPFFKIEVESIGIADNAVEGFEKTPSGLQYRILREGTGPKPTARDSVLAHYKGQLTNGKEFDSSYKRGNPISFPLSGVIPGWTEGMQLIGEGGMIEFILPYQLGYGEGGTSGIPGLATLQFIVELQKVN